MHFLFIEFTTDSLFLSRVPFVMTIAFANSLSIHFLFREFHLLLIIFFFAFNLLSLSRILFQSNFLRIHFEWTILFVTLLWILYLFLEYNLNRLSFSRIHFESTFSFANSILIHYYFANSLWIDYLFREFPVNPFSFSRIH